ncbi:MAG TPA: hypothetical protein VFP27_13110 [Mycobacterium sp.]|nr:hypothetical protein [Mycobacterium sp.]
MSEQKISRGGVRRQHGQQTRVHSRPSGLGRGRSFYDADSYRRRAEIVLPDRHEAVAYLARPQAAIGAEEDSTHIRANTLVDGCLPVRDRQLVEDLGAS